MIWLGDMFKQKLLRFLLSAILLYLVFLTIKPLLKSGYYPMHDDIHPMRVLQMDKCVRDLQFPCRWVPDMGYGFGYPQFNYYAPLPYYVMEVFHLSGFGILDSIKIYLILLTFISVWGMYKAGSKFWNSKTAGFVSAIFYTYLPYKAVNLYVRGALSEYTAQALIPITLYYVLCITNNGKRTDILKLTIALSALFLSHNISALFVLPYLAAIVVWKLKAFNASDRATFIKNLSFAFAGSLILSAFFLLPAFFERSLVHSGTLTSNYFDFRGHFLSIFQILFSNSWGYGSSVYGENDQIMLGIGLLFWFFPLIAVILSAKKRGNLKKLILLNLLAWTSLFFVHIRSSFIWEGVPLMEYIQFPWRFNLFAGIFFCLAVGYFGILKLGKNANYFLITFLTILLLLFNGSFFRPDHWSDISDSEKLSGGNWDLAQTVSINDYLPIDTSLSPAKKASDVPVVLSGAVDFVSFEKGTDWQRWKVNVSADAVVSAEIFYFPNWIAYVDKKKVDFNYKDHNGIITLELPAGGHEVILKLNDTPIRIIGNMITLIGTPLFLALYFKKSHFIKRDLNRSRS